MAKGLKAALVKALKLWRLAERLLSHLHEGQEEYVWHEPVNEFSGVDQGLPGGHGYVADRIALLSDRRFGKTYASVIYATALCLTRRRGSVMYIGLQKDVARGIFLQNFYKIRDEFDVPCVVDEREYTIFFPDTDSQIVISGADNPRLARLFRGKEHDLVVIDEAQDFRYIDLEHFINNEIISCLDDREGRLFLSGTPGNEEAGFFYDVVVTEKHDDYAVVHGKPFTNPSNRKRRLKRMAAMRATNPKIEEEAWVQREYFGRWVVDNRDLMVSLNPQLNYIRDWGALPGDEYILSIDWGFTAPSAYVLGVWNPKRNNVLVYLEAWEQKEMMLLDHLAAIDKYRTHAIYGKNLRIIADPGGSNKAIVEELRKTYKIPIENATKDGKSLILDQVNMDASLGNIQVFNVNDPDRPQDCGVAVQWNKLTWIKDPKTREKKEGSPRHIHDAALYLRRAARIELYEKPKEDVRTVEEKIRQKKAKRIRRRLKRKRVYA